MNSHSDDRPAAPRHSQSGNSESNRIESRRFASPCIIAASNIAMVPGVPSVSVPAVAPATLTHKLELVEVDGVVRQIVLHCACEQEHRIGLDYHPINEQHVSS